MSFNTKATARQHTYPPSNVDAAWKMSNSSMSMSASSPAYAIAGGRRPAFRGDRPRATSNHKRAF